MEAILKFNLPEDEDDFNLAVQVHSLFRAMGKFDQELRTMWKHRTLHPDGQELDPATLDYVRDVWLGVLEEERVQLYD
jgi:hypothetical protein